MFHSFGQWRHGPGSIACWTAVGVPTRGIHANMRRLASPWTPMSPPAMALVPRKSNRSQPSTDCASSSAWMAGRRDVVSIFLLEARGSVERPPIGAPLARAFPAARASHMLHVADRADQHAEQLFDGRFV